MASSRVSYDWMPTTGPNTSRAHTFMSGVTSVSNVGTSTPSSPTWPPTATLAPSATASSTHDVTRSRSPVEMRADTSVSSDSGSPTTNDATRSARASVNSGATERCTYTRCVEMHDWPAWL